MKVVVVGAGVIGGAVAHELSSRGAEVSVVDMRGTGQGATRASAGILAPYIEGHLAQLLRLGVCSLSLYDAFVRRVAADAGQEFDYRRTGTLQVARTDVEAARLVEAGRELATAEVPHELVGPEDVRRFEPALSSAIVAGLVIPDHGYVDVTALVSALKIAAERRGAVWLTGTVQRLEPREAGVRVVIDGHASLEADAVVLAAGSWSSRIGLGAAPPMPVRPIRGQLIHLRFTRPPVSRVIWGDACYMVPWLDGSLLVGATVEDAGFDESVSEEATRFLLESAAELLPAVTASSRTDVRVGLRPASADQLPLIGASSTMRGVFHATGHYRNGVLLAPLTAKLLADLMMDGRADSTLDLVRPDRVGL